jgi:hypothetical protein
MKNPSKILIILTLAIFFIWQKDSLAQTNDVDLSATVNFKADEKINPETGIEITFSRNLKGNEKIAVTFDQMDVTSLFKQTETRFIYDAKTLSLPIGNSNLTIYSIAENNSWKEIARFPMSVEAQKSESSAVADGLTSTETKNESETKTETKSEETKTETTTAETKTETQTEKNKLFNFLPTFTISMKAQPAQTNFPAENRPENRATFNDFTFTGSLRNATKIGNFSSDSNFDFAGSTFKQETLQFSTKGKDAPDIDLASYLINFQIGKAKFAWGHTSFGENRNLVSSFSSRGLSFELPLNKRFDIKAGALNGTSLVGVGNFSGLGKIRHQVQGATFGIELFPKRKNAARIEITGFNGYLQALNGVSEGRIVDAERSRGFGLKFITSDKSERFKIEFGYSLSRFFNPQDTTLDPDGNAVALPATLRSASYAEISYQILKDVKLTETKNLNLNFAFKFEIAEPLYKSLGASASADRFSHDYALDGSVGEITFQYAHGRLNDNLRNIPSILKSLTRGNRFSIALPFSALIGKSEKPSPFLPRLGYSFDRTHQFGAGIPVNGGFEIDPSTIPDQFNTNQTFSSAWQFQKFNVEYTYNRTFADNRQAEFEKNDQIGWTHGVTVSVNPLQILSFNVGLNFDTSKNLEILQTNKTKTLTFGTNLQPFKNATLSGNFSNTLSGDAANIVNNRNANFDVQFAYNFSIEKSKFRKFGMQAFVRFADTYARNRDVSFDLNNRTRTKIVNAGLTFNFF